MPNIALAENILHIELTIYPNETAILNEMTLSEGIETRFLNPGEYEIDMLGQDNLSLYSRNFSVNFFILSDPPMPANKSELTLKIPYDPEMNILEVYKGDKLILSKEINLCNNNRLCETDYENFLSCPKDCPLDKNDSYCLNKSDGICDPDCFEGVDPDCNLSSSTSNQISHIYPALIVLIVLALGIIIIQKRRKK
jgi:hypothetical protein